MFYVTLFEQFELRFFCVTNVRGCSLSGRFQQIVQLRNEVVDSLEMDRQREAQEDRVSISSHLHISFRNIFIAVYGTMLWYTNELFSVLPVYRFLMQSIKERLERHTAQRDEEELSQQTPTKLSKKEKKKQKESKKLAKQKKLDLDKVIFLQYFSHAAVNETT